MKRCISGMAILGLLGLLTLGAWAQAPDPEAMTLARKLTEEGAKTFDTADAKAMIASYTDDAKVTLEGRDDSGFSLRDYATRDEIEGLYRDMFKDKNPGSIASKNTVEYAKLLAPDMLVIAGVFEPDTNDPNSLKVPFYQVRIKKGEHWLISSMRIFVVGKSDS